MYKGNNPIAIQSRNWMIDALLSLMKEKPYVSISIANICQRAGLSRQTFYNFFNEKDDILRFRLHECYGEMSRDLQSKKDLQMTDITDSFARFFTNHEEFLTLMVNNGLDNIIAQGISAAIETFSSQFAPEEKTHRCLYGNAFLTGALTRLLITWFNDTERLSPEELSELLVSIFSGNYYVFKSEEMTYGKGS
ncbi:MAG: TetR/AcrR family transcriptional regulator [Syntrophomonas sp.]